MLSILITAYKNIDQVKDNINNFRSNFTIPEIKNAPIICTFTSEEVLNWDLLTVFDNVHIIHIPNAPGSNGSNFVPKTKATDWRGKYLTARNFTALHKGFDLASKLGSDVLYHLHSDTSFKGEKELNLYSEVLKIRNEQLLLYGDVSDYEDKTNLPFPGHILPENLLVNLTYANQVGFSNFLDIYKSANSDMEYVDKEQFHSPDWIGIEAVLPGWAEWCLSKRNVLCKQDKWSDLYLEKVKCRMKRGHHGEWDNGLINLGGTQPFGNKQ